MKNERLSKKEGTQEVNSIKRRGLVAKQDDKKMKEKYKEGMSYAQEFISDIYPDTNRSKASKNQHELHQKNIGYIKH